MGRKKLPESERKVRVVIYAKAGHVSAAKAYAEQRDLDLSRLTDQIYAKTSRFHRTENDESLQT